MCLSTNNSDAGRSLVNAVLEDPALSLVDALLKQPMWAGTLGDDDVRALRRHEAELHALDVEWRAQRLYDTARRRRSAAKRRHSQGTITCDADWLLQSDFVSTTCSSLLLFVQYARRAVDCVDGVCTNTKTLLLLWTQHVAAGVRLRGAAAVKLVRTQGMSRVEAVLQTHPALRRKLTADQVSRLEEAEVAQTNGLQVGVHSLLIKASHMVYSHRAPHQRTGVCCRAPCFRSASVDGCGRA